MLGHRTKVNWLCQTEDNKNKNINILGISEQKQEITIIHTTKGKNPLEKME